MDENKTRQGVQSHQENLFEHPVYVLIIIPKTKNMKVIHDFLYC